MPAPQDTFQPGVEARRGDASGGPYGAENRAPARPLHHRANLAGPSRRPQGLPGGLAGPVHGQPHRTRSSPAPSSVLGIPATGATGTAGGSSVPWRPPAGSAPCPRHAGHSKWSPQRSGGVSVPGLALRGWCRVLRRWSSSPPPVPQGPPEDPRSPGAPLPSLLRVFSLQ